ncbi:hypothetical protein CDAR_38501 [Caerostris darwini]|uniref:Uncharacterized protein n=1 Tax=Caerostris darwini TaxID=1538125 RepID=A0AAV4UQL2_9ARAC|nr:hypothetical protein CDAR_38501 [Caerostris darwini]
MLLPPHIPKNRGEQNLILPLSTHPTEKHIQQYYTKHTFAPTHQLNHAQVPAIFPRNSLSLGKAPNKDKGALEHPISFNGRRFSRSCRSLWAGAADKRHFTRETSSSNGKRRACLNGSTK